MKRKMVWGVLLLLLCSTPALATGINIYFNDNSIQDKSGGTLAYNNYHPYKTPLEFFYNTLPAPNSSAGKMSVDTATQYIAGEKKYQLSSLDGGTLHVRVWNGAVATQGSYYGKTSHGVAGGTTLPYDWTITELKTSYKADVPYTPTIGTVSESLQRTGTTYKLTLVVPISYNENGSDGIREITGSSILITYPSGSSETKGSPATLTGTPTGTYKFKPTVTNWFGSTSGAEVSYTTLGGGAAQEEVTLTLKKKTGDFGINSIALPFAAAYTETGEQIVTVKDLVTKLNAAGEGYVATFGYWDETNQLEVGFTFDSNGAAVDKLNTTLNPEEISLERARGYQVSTTGDKTIKLRNYQ